MGEVPESRARLLQTKGNGSAWESCPMLYTSETFFLCCGYQHAVPYDARGAVRMKRVQPKD